MLSVRAWSVLLVYRPPPIRDVPCQIVIIMLLLLHIMGVVGGCGHCVSEANLKKLAPYSLLL